MISLACQSHSYNNNSIMKKRRREDEKTRPGGRERNTSEFVHVIVRCLKCNACHATSHLPLSASKRCRAVPLANFSNQNGNRFEDGYEISLCIKVSGGRQIKFKSLHTENSILRIRAH
jgi:hypothetical protein